MRFHLLKRERIEQGGIKTLTITGPGMFCLWSGDSTNSTLLLSSGETITNGLPHAFPAGMNTVWVQAVSNGAATLTLAFQGTGVASNYNVVRTLPISACGVDVDIDNVNCWGNDYFNHHYLATPESRALRDQVGVYTGKVLFVNDIDKNGSGTPDYMDGWDCPLQQIPLLEREKPNSRHREQNTSDQFVPMSVSVSGW